MPKNTGFNVQRLALNRSEVALSLGVSSSSVDTMVTEGFLPPPRQWHSRKLWLVSEVEAYLNEWPSDAAATAVNVLDRLLGGNDSDAGEAEWRRKVIASPLNQRERKALKQLLAYGEGEWAHRTKVYCGPDTQERLETRGYLKIRNQIKFPDRVDSYALTAEGRSEAAKL